MAWTVTDRVWAPDRSLPHVVIDSSALPLFHHIELPAPAVGTAAVTEFVNMDWYFPCFEELLDVLD